MSESKKIKLSKITINIGNQSIQLSPEKAKELYNVLKKVVSEEPQTEVVTVKEHHHYPYYPVIIEQPKPYFEWDFPTEVICDGSGSSSISYSANNLINDTLNVQVENPQLSEKQLYLESM